MSFQRDVNDAYGEFRGSAGTLFKFGSCALLLLFGLGAVSGVMSYTAGWFSEAGSVVREEAGPRALLRKYEWFKDASARLSALDADIRLYDVRITDFAGMDRSEMDRFDKAELRQIKAERLGVVATYNSLAAEYNAAMAKINYAFCNVGELPSGADQVLPRGYPEYKVE